MHFCVGEYNNQKNETLNEFKITLKRTPMIHMNTLIAMVILFFCLFKHKQIVDTNACKFMFTIEITINVVRFKVCVSILLFVYFPFIALALRSLFNPLHYVHSILFIIFFVGFKCALRWPHGHIFVAILSLSMLPYAMNANRCSYVINTYRFMCIHVM